MTQLFDDIITKVRQALANARDNGYEPCGGSLDIADELHRYDAELEAVDEDALSIAVKLVLAEERKSRESPEEKHSP